MLDQPSVSAKKIRSAVTDSEAEVRYDVEHKPGVSNLLTIYSALTGTPVAALAEQYAGRGYGDLKKDLAEVTVDFVTPFRERTLELLDDRSYLDEVLRQGAAEAGAVARAHPARRLRAGRLRGRRPVGSPSAHHRSRPLPSRALGLPAAGLPHGHR